ARLLYADLAQLVADAQHAARGYAVAIAQNRRLHDRVKRFNPGVDAYLGEEVIGCSDRALCGGECCLLRSCCLAIIHRRDSVCATGVVDCGALAVPRLRRSAVEEPEGGG